jgi:hypothetical protein
MDMALLDCGLPEASRPVYKKGDATWVVAYLCVRHKTLNFRNRSPTRVPSLCLCIRDLARIKQTTRRR